MSINSCAAFGVDYRLASARVGIRAKGTMAALLPNMRNEVLEKAGRRLGVSAGTGAAAVFAASVGTNWSFRGLPLGFPLFFLDKLPLRNSPSR